MKVATFTQDNQPRVGIVVDDQIFGLAACQDASGKGKAANAASTLALLAAGQPALDAAQEAVAWAQANGDSNLSQPLAAVELLAPLPCPGKLLCLAGNYAEHIQEGGGTFVGKEKMIPRFFSKPCTSIVGTGAAVRIPPSAAWADWELELAVVIGKRGRDLSAEEAVNHIRRCNARSTIMGAEVDVAHGASHFPKCVARLMLIRWGH